MSETLKGAGPITDGPGRRDNCSHVLPQRAPGKVSRRRNTRPTGGEPVTLRWRQHASFRTARALFPMSTSDATGRQPNGVVRVDPVKQMEGVSTRPDGMGNRVVFLVSCPDQRNGSRAFVPSAFRLFHPPALKGHAAPAPFAGTPSAPGATNPAPDVKRLIDGLVADPKIFARSVPMMLISFKDAFSFLLSFEHRKCGTLRFRLGKAASTPYPP